MQPPRVSVLIPAYNSGWFLGEAVRSVLAQTCADWELIVIDDASTDGAVEALPCRDPRLVRLRNSTNLGQSRSLNRGLAVASGRYVACLDHDDLAEPQRLQMQADFLDKHPDICLLGTWATVIDHGGAVLARPPASPPVLAWSLAGGCPLTHSSIMFRRESVLALGGYDPSAAPADDYDLWTRLVRAGGRAAVLPLPLCRVRRHAGQLSRVKAQEQARVAVAIAGRHVAWLLGEPACPGHVDALLSLFDAAGGGCRHPKFVSAIALLTRLAVKGARRFGNAAEIRREAVRLLASSAVAALREAGRFSGSIRLLARAVRASFAAARLACN